MCFHKGQHWSTNTLFGHCIHSHVYSRDFILAWHLICLCWMWKHGGYTDISSPGWSTNKNLAHNKLASVRWKGKCFDYWTLYQHNLVMTWGSCPIWGKWSKLHRHVTICCPVWVSFMRVFGVLFICGLHCHRGYQDLPWSCTPNRLTAIRYAALHKAIFRRCGSCRQFTDRQEKWTGTEAFAAIVKA